MSNQIVISSGAKVRNLNGVLTGTAGVVDALGINVPSGIPQLDGSGKILVSQLPNSVMEYKGTWNAATNTPTLVNGTGNQGDVYLVSVAGTVNFGAGPITFAVGDQVIYSGSIWQKAGGSTGTVTSVAVTESGDALTITGSPITTSGTINIGFAGTSGQYVNGAGGLTTFPTLISSIGLSMPSAFNVANSPLTANGTIAVTGAGVASQYIRGDGTLANFPTSGGGGSSVSYYLNGSINQGTIGGVTYYEMNKVPVIGAGTDFSRGSNGYIASFLTDANDPALLEIPAGNWNFETYFNASNGGGSPTFYIELYKYDGTTFTLIASNSATPKLINDGASIEAYFSALAVPQTTLTLTDRLAVRIYVNTSGRTITLHTENSHLCQVITTFSTGITALNGLTAQVQFLATGTSGTDFNISSSTATHTFNMPDASATNRGLITTGTQTIAGAKTFTSGLGGTSAAFSGSLSVTGNTSLLGNLGAKFGIIIEKGNTPATLSLNDVYISASSGTTNSLKIQNTNYLSTLNFSQSNQTFTFPEATGTLALTSQLHDAVTIGSANGLSLSGQVLSLALSSTSTNGALSSTDWNTFNGKQAALNGTGFVKISGTTISYDNSTYLTTSAAASTYLPLAGGTLTGQLVINRASGNGLQVASDNVVITAATGFGSPRQLVFTCGNGPTTTLEAKGFGGNYITDFNIKTYNSSGTAFNVFFGDSAGNVGIGTDTPLSRLQVVATGTILRLGEASGTTGKQLLFGVDSASGRGEIQAVWQGTAHTTLALNPAGGNVGIGLTNPTSKLHISSSSADAFTTLETNSGFSAYNRNKNGNRSWVYGVDGTNSNFIVFDETAALTRFAITSGGNVGIGTSSPNSLSSGINLITRGVSGFTTSYIQALSADGGASVALYSGSGSSDNPSIIYQNSLRFGTANDSGLTGYTERIRFTSNGNVNLNDTVYNNTAVAVARILYIGSDYRIGGLASIRESKKNIKDVLNVDWIYSLNPVTFNYRKKDEEEKYTDEIYDELVYGLIAEDTAPIADFLINYNAKEDGTKEMVGIEYMRLITPMLKAIQELKAEIEELKNK